ncbi:uncharacterized protein LOC117565116 isoform X1 [Drosophila albomicans]|uniref:Uncharacterized protein LOC117565116 isoform X1 n=1 Tax=Drosophila albomicans TaxID=7291 RepID=A0A6P8WPJ8_DROAB|nr:uncharacterized protein LOC117565116 isoform X1 [Drosophila albomicans]
MPEETVIVKEEIDIDDTKIKLEFNDEEPPPLKLLQGGGLLEIIEERPNMITVPVHDYKSEDELKFIASLAAIDEQQTLFMTPACKSNEAQVFRECECKICTFICKNHLALGSHHINHQLNRHFCRNGCDFWCNTLEEMLEHEYRQHPVGFTSQFSCRICEKKFCTAVSLSSHMATHCYERRFVCAICRYHYASFEELQVHRQCSKAACGRIVYADRQDNIGELVLVNKLNNAVPSELCNVHIKEEPLNAAEEQFLKVKDIIKTEPKDDQVEQLKAGQDVSWSSASLMEKLRSKLRLPAIKKADVKVETAHSSSNTKFDKFNQISEPVAKRPNILKPARNNQQAPNGISTVASNILKVLPNNCMLFKLPANTKIVKISNTTHNGSIISEGGNKIPSLPLTPPSITPPVSSTNRNAYFSDLSSFESTPESQKIIEDIKNQIRNIEQTCPLPGSVLHVPKHFISCMTPQPTNQPVEVLSLPLTKNSNATVREMRIAHPTYRFSWQCPYCALCYELYSAFCKHLSFTHNVQQSNMDDIIVQVKASKISIAEISNLPKKAEPSPLTPVAEAATSDQKVVTDATYKLATIPADTASSTAPATPLSPASGASQPKRNTSVIRPAQYQCEDCSKCFTTVGALRIHKMIHTGELPHKCNYCDKRFRTPGQVRVHQRRHTGEKPFKCKICALAFTHRETLISHLSRHIGMKRYKCYGCDKNFVVVSGLRAHRRLRPDTCGKVKFTARAHGPRVRVIRGEVFFESHPEHNGYLRSEDPINILSERNHVDMEPDVSSNVVS